MTEMLVPHVGAGQRMIRLRALPRKREREQTEFAARLIPSLRGRSRSGDYGFPLEFTPAKAGAGTTASHAAAADLPIAAFTRGMTSSAINCIERLLSAGSTQSIPA